MVKQPFSISLKYPLREESLFQGLLYHYEVCRKKEIAKIAKKIPPISVSKKRKRSEVNMKEIRSLSLVSM